jgi:hypothetical protein
MNKLPKKIICVLLTLFFVAACISLVEACDPTSTDPTSTDPTSTDPTSTDPISTDIIFSQNLFF